MRLIEFALKLSNSCSEALKHCTPVFLLVSFDLVVAVV